VAHTLLLADDSVTIQRVIELTFADEDVRVVAVSDGDQAIAVLDKTPPDIVLADVGMPGKNGYEVAEHMKNTPRLAHIPIMLLTGAFEPIDQAKAAAAGCDGVLAKPFEPQLVIGRVRELLAKPKQIASSSDAPLAPPPAPAKPLATPIVEPPFASQTSPNDGRDYFDRLDRAFANLTSQPDGQRSVADAIDWFATHPPGEAGSAPAASVPAASAPAAVAPMAPAERWDSRPIAAPEPPAPVTHTPPVASTPMEGTSSPAPSAAPPAVPALTAFPPLAEAFAALLAAEQSAPPPSAAPLWPAAPSLPAAVTDDLVEQVTRQVLERLSDRVLRETVSERVSNVAERLVREEIERIRASLK
jgi:CheY-like chemotaxis protein